MYWIF